MFLLLPFSVYAGDFYNSTSFQGYTGIINTPNAEILEDKKVEFSFSNQVDAERIRDSRDDYEAQHYFINLGIMPNLEFTSRLANIEKKDKDSSKVYGNFLDRDISFAFKYQLPFYHEYLPNIAIGVQDPVGNGRYKSKYLVASKKISFIRASAGYGFDSDRLDGLFGGAEVKLTDFAYILGEYDSKETQVGFRLNTPDSLSNYFDLSFLAKTNIDDDNQKVSFALNLKAELGNDFHLTTGILNLENNSNLNQVNIEDNIINLKNELINFGFENIDIGINKDTIYVAYENNIFDKNELDAIGSVVGLISKQKLSYEKFEIVIKKSNQKLLRIRGDLNSYKSFISEATVQSTNNFLNSLQIDKNFDNDKNLVIENENSSYMKPRVELSANIHSFIGTEVGVFDYLISARPYLHINIYKGFDLGVLGDFPLYHTRNYDDDRPFRYYNNGNKLESLLLHRSDIFNGFINIASVGSYRDYIGGFDELTYSYDDHIFSMDVGYLEDDDNKKDIYLGSYSYYYDSYDSLFSIRGGKYYNQDEGFDVSIKRFFGDTAINFFYQNTDTQYIGLGVEVPLTPRRVANSKYGQFKGKRDFEYHFRTSVKDKSGINVINPKDAKIAIREFDVKSRFLNRYRLSEDYIKKHILRFRDVYFRYLEN
jgi:hypothetical protein